MFLITTSVRADSFMPRAVISWQSFEAGALSTSGLRQTYDLQLEKSLSAPATLRLFFRGEDYGGTSEQGEAAVESESRRLQPGVDFRYQLPQLLFQTTYSSVLAESESAAVGTSSDLERFFSRLSWTPEKLPAVNVYVARNRLSDIAGRADTVEQMGFASLDYNWTENLQVSVTERYSTLDDGRAGFTRRNLSHQAYVNYDQVNLGGKLTTSASATALFSRFDDRAAGGPVLVPTPVPVRQALHAIDDTPLDGRDHPLIPFPALIDNNQDQAAGISLGPDSSSFQNIALDLGRFAEIDEIRVLVRDAEGNRVRTGGTIQWDVYTSDDAVLWRLSSSGITSSFDPAESEYSIRFALTTTRWIKLVTFGVNALETYITEIEAFFHTELINMRQTDARFYNAATTLSARPSRWVTLSYGGLFNAFSQDFTDRPRLSSTDWDHNALIQIDPNRHASVAGRYRTRIFDSSNGPVQSFDSWAGIVRILPLSSVDLSLEVSGQTEDIQDVVARTHGLVFHAFARILPSLDLAIELGEQSQDRAGEEFNGFERRYVSALTNMQLFRSVRFLFAGVAERTSRPGENGLMLPPEQNDRWFSEVQWRPGQPLALSARLGWVSGRTTSGYTQRYGVEWYPFAQGTVSLGARYDQDIDPNADRKSSQLIFTPRWTMNNHAMFDLSYIRVLTSFATEEFETESFNATMTLRK